MTDDATFFAEIRTELEGTMKELSYYDEEAGLTTNIKKIKILIRYKNQEGIKIKRKKTVSITEESHLR